MSSFDSTDTKVEIHVTAISIEDISVRRLSLRLVHMPVMSEPYKCL